MRHLRATFLILSALLLMLGHGAKVGFCPCHQTLFFNDCGCTGIVETCGDSCSGGCSDHSGKLAGEDHQHNPENGSHDCGNITAEISPFYYVFGGEMPSTPSFSVEYIAVQSTPFSPVFYDWEQIKLPWKTGPPPGLVRPFTGFLCPLLI